MVETLSYVLFHSAVPEWGTYTNKFLRIIFKGAQDIRHALL